MGPYDYPALEGGYGWLVVLSGFCIHVLTRGCLFSTGILFSEWTTYFDTSKSETAWIGSIATGFALMIGPLASKLIERFGYRKTALAGGIVSFVGLFTSSWANSVLGLCLTYGVLAGAGMGITYLCGVVAVGEYFDGKRSLAFGISASGAGFGAAVMAILQQILIDEYGWRGSLIILSGLSGLNQLAFGTLLRPLSSSINWKSEKRSEILKKHECANQFYLTRKALPGQSEEENDFIQSHEAAHTSYSSSINTVNPGKKPLDTLYVSRHYMSSVSPSMQLRRKQMLTLQEKISDSKRDDLNNAVPNQIVISLDHDDGVDIDQAVTSSFGSIARSMVSNADQLKITSSDAVYLSTLSIASSRKVVENISKTRCTYGRNVLNDNLSEEDLGRVSTQNISTLDINNNYGERRVLTNPFFLVLAINQFFTGLAIMIPFIHLSQKAILMGFGSKEAAYLISVIGIGNVVGKVALGVICDMEWSNILVVFFISQFGLATSVALYPIASGYVFLVVASLLFGFFYGNYCAIPSLLVKFVGLNNLAEAIGYINFLEGVSGIIGPPLAGAIYDSSKSYAVAFAASAGFLFVSVIVLGAYPLLNRNAQRTCAMHNKAKDMNLMDDGVMLDYNANEIDKSYF